MRFRNLRLRPYRFAYLTALSLVAVACFGWTVFPVVLLATADFEPIA